MYMYTHVHEVGIETAMPCSICISCYRIYHSNKLLVASSAHPLVVGAWLWELLQRKFVYIADKFADFLQIFK